MNGWRAMEPEVQDEVERLRREVAALRAEVARLHRAGAAARTDAGEAGAALPRGEERLRAIVESAVDYAIITADLQDRITSWNEGAVRLLGWTEVEALGRPCRMIFTPEDCAAGVPQAEMHQALEEGRAADERWHIRRDGSRFFAVGELLPLRGDGGGLLGYLKILRDRTAQRREEECRRLLLNELNHRAKNTLAVVQSVVAQTARGAGSADELREALEARLGALAGAHDLLTREKWRGAELAELVRATLAPYAGAGDPARAWVDGPGLRLVPNAALALAMALHELAANAARYGALSTPEGYVEVSWSVDRPAGAPGNAALDLLWRERGGPPVAPPSARGFGSQLIEDGLPYQFGGSVRLLFEPEGVECRFLLPLSGKLEAA